MIRSKRDLLAYLDADRVNLGCPKTLRNYLFHDVWRYQRVLRRLEYQLNCKRGPLHKPRELWLRFRLKRLSKEIGVYIKPNNFGPGLAIVHEGMIRVHKNARIGANCRIHVDVNIGASGGVPGVWWGAGWIWRGGCRGGDGGERGDRDPAGGAKAVGGGAAGDAADREPGGGERGDCATVRAAGAVNRGLVAGR